MAAAQHTKRQKAKNTNDVRRARGRFVMAAMSENWSEGGRINRKDERDPIYSIPGYIFEQKPYTNAYRPSGKDG
jgi:hypothetical protein